MCRILRCLEAPGAAEGWKCECLKDLGSGKLSVSYSTVSGGSWDVSAVAKVGNMGDAAWRIGTPQITVSWRRSVVWATPTDVSWHALALLVGFRGAAAFSPRSEV